MASSVGDDDKIPSGSYVPFRPFFSVSESARSVSGDEYVPFRPFVINQRPEIPAAPSGEEVPGPEEEAPPPRTVLEGFVLPDEASRRVSFPLPEQLRVLEPAALDAAGAADAGQELPEWLSGAIKEPETTESSGFFTGAAKSGTSTAMTPDTRESSGAALPDQESKPAAGEAGDSSADAAGQKDGESPMAPAETPESSSAAEMPEPADAAGAPPESACENGAGAGTGAKKPDLGRRIVNLVGTLLIIASIVTVLSPVWIRYWDRYNPFSTVQDKPVLPVIDLSAARDIEFPEPLPVGASGILEIPALELKEAVAYGIDTVTLESGLGFYPQSGVPAKGNVSIAGHRNMAGSPFLKLNELVKGDQILLEYDGKLYTYAVDSVFITNDRDWSVIDPTPQPALTLTTCDPAIRPLDGKYDRLIVRAYLQTSN